MGAGLGRAGAARPDRAEPGPDAFHGYRVRWAPFI
jgi:hypothetical protein